jgi:hypothetical protein
MAKEPITISNQPITIEDLRLFLSQNRLIVLSETSKKKIARNRKFLDKKSTW